jgi:hypothetical protein
MGGTEMNESLRTLAFLIAGAAAALVAFATRPVLEDREVAEPEIVGKPLFPDFKDPLAARSLEIKQFDEATARVVTFSVAQQANGRWVIPSHGNYPADAQSQLRAVAELLSDLKCVGIASDSNTDHELYGVKDPDKAEVGTAGVGTLIAMQDAKGDDLLRLIVGKEVAGATNQRFVRKPNEDRVYVTTIDLSKLPTEFDKWIEKDLLKLSTFDVTHVTLKDYQVLPTQSGRLALVPRMDAELSYDSSKGEWKLDGMFVYRGQQRQPSGLGELEELNKQKLDDMRYALGDLKIVDVVRKPEGLGNSLRVSSEKLPPEQQRELLEFGFYPSPAPDGTLDIYGKNGEVIVETRDGVQYILRFGDIAPQAATPSTAKKTDSASTSDSEQVKVHRYLFVTTQVAPSVLTPPQLEPEPAGPEPPPSAEKKDADKPATDKEAKKEGDAATGDTKSEEGKSDEPKVVDPQQAERERIRKENERKMNEYRDKKKKAETRVAELNARFADWYYVVSEDVYKKIRLVRSDIVKEAATAKEEGFGVDAFRKLEEEGLKASPLPGSTK